MVMLPQRGWLRVIPRTIRETSELVTKPEGFAKIFLRINMRNHLMQKVMVSKLRSVLKILLIHQILLATRKIIRVISQKTH